MGGSTVNKQLKNDILKALNDDMNTSVALSIVDMYISTTNEILDNQPKNKGLKKELISSVKFINDILGIGLDDSFKYFQFGIDEGEIKHIQELISQRDNAKKEKNFELSDELREQLKSMNISLMDTVNGTMWEKI